MDEAMYVLSCVQMAQKQPEFGQAHLGYAEDSIRRLMNGLRKAGFSPTVE